MKKPYFKKNNEDPAPLTGKVKTRVRFEEVDSMGIVWHGRFASFFEDARVSLSEKYKIGYMDLYSNGILSPIKTMHVDYINPLKFRDEITVEGILHYSDASRINSEYIIKNNDGNIAATGYSVQMMLNKNYELYLVQPDYYREFCEKWKAGLL